MFHLTVAQCDVQNAKCYINMTALMQTQFKLWSAAYHPGHQTLVPKD